MNKIFVIAILAALITVNLSTKVTSKQQDIESDPEDLIIDDSKDDLSKGVAEDAPKMEESTTETTGPGAQFQEEDQDSSQNEDNSSANNDQVQDQPAPESSTNKEENSVSEQEAQSPSQDQQQDSDNTVDDSIAPTQEQATNQDEDFNKNQDTQQETETTPSSSEEQQTVDQQVIALNKEDDSLDTKQFAQKKVENKDESLDGDIPYEKNSFGPVDLQITPDMYGANYAIEKGNSFLQLKSKTDIQPEDLKIEGHTGEDKQTQHYGNLQTLSSPPEQTEEIQQQDNVNLVQQQAGAFIQTSDVKKVQIEQQSSFGPEDLHISDNDDKSPNVYHEPIHSDDGVRSSPPGQPQNLNQAEIKQLIEKAALIQESEITFGPQDLKIEGHTGEIIKKDQQSYERQANDATNAPPEKEVDEQEQQQDQDSQQSTNLNAVPSADNLSIPPMQLLNNNQLDSKIDPPCGTLDNPCKGTDSDSKAQPLQQQISVQNVQDQSIQDNNEQVKQDSTEITNNQVDQKIQPPIQPLNADQQPQDNNNMNFVVKVNHLNNNPQNIKTTNLLVNPLKTRLRRTNTSE